MTTAKTSPWLLQQVLVAMSASIAGIGGGTLLLQEATACENANKNHKTFSRNNRLIFLGTGSSTGCPRPSCPLLFSSAAPSTPALEQMRQEWRDRCRTSNLAMRGGTPRTNKNYRNNPSLLLSIVTTIETDPDITCNHTTTDSNQLPAAAVTTTKNIVIDTGKTFREGALRWMPLLGITSLDAIVLTHHHMDAAAGLDDVRGFQMQQRKRTSGSSKGSSSSSHGPPVAKAMPLFLAQDCLDALRGQFPWLLPTPTSAQRKQQQKHNHNDTDDANNKPVVPRHVATFDVTVLEYFQPCNVVQAISITPLPVMHGEDLVSLGFAFTIGHTAVVYCSDISRMLPETLDFIRHRLPPTDLLIVDALHDDNDDKSRTNNPVHFNLRQAAQLAQQLQAKRVYLVGMNCDSFSPHDEMNERLQREYGNIQLAHDGLVLDDL